MYKQNKGKGILSQNSKDYIKCQLLHTKMEQEFERIFK